MEMNAKASLNLYCQKSKLRTPCYSTKNVDGGSYSSSVSIDGLLPPPAPGGTFRSRATHGSKKAAELDAARVAAEAILQQHQQQRKDAVRTRSKLRASDDAERSAAISILEELLATVSSSTHDGSTSKFVHEHGVDSVSRLEAYCSAWRPGVTPTYRVLSLRGKHCACVVVEEMEFGTRERYDDFDEAKRSAADLALSSLPSLDNSISDEQGCHGDKRSASKACSSGADAGEVEEEPGAGIGKPLSPTKTTPNHHDDAGIQEPKQRLNQFCQQRHMSLPCYDIRYPEDAVGYIATVTVGMETGDGRGVKCSSSVCKSKKEAEAQAALAALERLRLNYDGGNEFEASCYRRTENPHKEENTVTKVSYKNLLQERAQRNCLPMPIYVTRTTSDGFLCSLTVHTTQEDEGRRGGGSILVESEGNNISKKAAEQQAAKNACGALGINC